MSTSLKSTSRVAPAQLSYFAIYNPSLGPTDETVRDQIVFYYSKKLEDERERRKEEEPSEQEREQHKHHDDEIAENERLRQAGLAQGMVNFVQYVGRRSGAGPRNIHATPSTRTLPICGLTLSDFLIILQKLLQ